MDALGRSLVIKLAVAGVLLCVAWIAYLNWTEDLDDGDSLGSNSSLTEQSPVTTSNHVVQETTNAANDSEIDFSVRALSVNDKTAVLQLADSSLIVIRTSEILLPQNLKVIGITDEKVIFKKESSGENYFVFLSKNSLDSKWQKTSNRIPTPSQLPIKVISE